MHQLTQQLKSGKMEILEVPLPQLLPGYIMVQNFFSVISAGTESKTVSDARKGYLAKALSRQKEVKQVIELIKTQGLKNTYNIVMNKLEAPSPLGYSCAGEVIAVAADVSEYKVGDRVACGGNTANHSEIVVVPKNLCAKINETVDLREGAFTTIASIALQGIRQAELQVGNTCVVIGLGLIGIITLKILESSGIKAIGIDINSETVKNAIEKYKLNAILRTSPDLAEQVKLWSQTKGADSIIITASAKNNDPVNLAGELARHKGKVVMVGAVSPDFERVNYYRKELDLKMSCSYGPGRYDTLYEEVGIDYPVGYVRWTEQRNMQAILDLLANKKIQFSDLITHTFSLDEASEAYNLILSHKEPFLGILIRYNENLPNTKKKIALYNESKNPDKPNIGLIGAGSFAQNIMLPILKKYANLIGIATSHGNHSVYTGMRYQFKYATTEPELFNTDPDINTVFILTRHNLHASLTIQALKSGKNVFVEKPLALNKVELDEIKNCYESLDNPKPLIMTGFNRRFSQLTLDASEWINLNLPKSINIRVNASPLPDNHWVNNRSIGGGRLIGEGCHFIDLAIFLAGSKVNTVSAVSMNNSGNLDDTLTISMKFQDGSIANISYFSNGNKTMSKEFIEIFSGQNIVQIHDFQKLKIYTPGKKIVKKYNIQDKGHTNQIKSFLRSINEGLPSPISFEDIYHSMKITLEVSNSLKESRTIHIQE